LAAVHIVNSDSAGNDVLSYLPCGIVGVERNELALSLNGNHIIRNNVGGARRLLVLHADGAGE
jgi:hypothetical protein